MAKHHVGRSALGVMSRRVGTAVVVALAASLVVAGCEAEGDGDDDRTGEPVGTSGGLSEDSGSCPEEYHVESHPDTGEVIDSDPPLSEACQQALQEQHRRLTNGFNSPPPPREWIVWQTVPMSPDECVIGLEQAPPNPDDHYSRRVTTAEDCAAQTVGEVYRPIGSAR
jgi:hypothetical protein